LASLIEGLLDVSKIEAGRVTLARREVRIHELLDQIVDMFRLQAQAKGIEFTFVRQETLPEVVYTDEKRLRQIVINLLSNAMKFTEQGHVVLRVAYRSQIAYIEIEDSGVGIEGKDLQRIFEPFERVYRAGLPSKPGIGLGLTITKLIAEIMGGEVSVTSDLGRGSRFLVKLMLSEVVGPTPLRPPDAQICGYVGPRLIVVVADDDPTHRDMIREILNPLGFVIFDAVDGPDCIAVADRARPNLFLLDISMPGMNGWQLAQLLRRAGHHDAPIIMVSANAQEIAVEPDSPHNEYVIKPVDIPQLLAKIGSVLRIEWLYGPGIPGNDLSPGPVTRVPPQRYLDELQALGRIGYIRGIRRKLDEIEGEEPDHGEFVTQMRTMVDNFDVDRYMAALRALSEADPAL
jgi:CheY-like chemotaxis protein/anti-sigma regulatory factor (Ser/Thr protein kinase)